MDMKADQVKVDWASFEPWRIKPVKHRLMQHALLRFEQMIENTVLDACLLAGFCTAAGGRDWIRRLARCPPRADRSPYACIGRH